MENFRVEKKDEKREICLSIGENFFVYFVIKKMNFKIKIERKCQFVKVKAK